jgi:hypothetical protein
MFAEKTLKDDRVTVAEGTFEAIDAEDGWADLVVIAQVSPFRLDNSLKNRGLDISFGRRSIGVLTMKRLHENLLESSSLKARWLSSGT